MDGSAGVPALSSDADDAPPPAKRAQRQKPFDFTKYPSRHVALHVMYAGWNYHGFASQGADASGVDTVETQLFAALKKCRLIAPDATWQSCDYTRCGRTDAGVSALSQVITLRLSCQALFAPPRDPEGPRHGAAFDDRPPGGQRRAARVTLPAPPPPTDDDDELDYPNVLNRALPDDVRILGWSYVDADFSARFRLRVSTLQIFFRVRGAAWTSRRCARRRARWRVNTISETYARWTRRTCIITCGGCIVARWWTRAPRRDEGFRR